MPELAMITFPVSAWTSTGSAYRPLSGPCSGAADSLADSLPAVDPQAVFGPDSWATLLYADPAVPCGHPFSGTLVFQCLTAALLIAYCFLAAGFPSSPGHLFKLMRNRTGLGVLAAEQSYPFEQFLRYGSLVGLLAFSLGCVRTGEIFLYPAGMFRTAWLAVPVAMGTTAAIVLVQWIVLQLAGRLAGNVFFVQNLFYLKKLTCTFGTILLTPVLLLLALSGDKYGAEAFGTAILVAFVLVLLIFLWKSLRLFAEQKVSILYWFLYLCAVEVLPVSFVVLLVVKNA